MLLPKGWNMRDPQRVCTACAAQLAPKQMAFAESHSNATRTNVKLNTSGPRRYFNRPLNFTLGGEIRKAVYILENVMHGVETLVDDTSIQTTLVKQAKALLFMTTVKVAFIGGVHFGTGLLVTKLKSRQDPNHIMWSAPCAVGAFGMSIGAEAGVATVDMIVPIVDDNTLREFASGEKHLTLSGEAGLSFGPIGRNYSKERYSNDAYSHSKGIYGGISLQGAMVTVRSDVNHKYYGREISATKIMTGEVPAPVNAKPLYDKLDEYFAWAFHEAAPPTATSHNQPAAAGSNGTPPPQGVDPHEGDVSV